MRKLLLAVVLVSLAGSAFGAGTFATFNASTTNASSTFATGTLVLSDKTTNANNTQTSCISTNSLNTDTNDGTGGGTCGTIFNTTLAKPGDTATMDLDLKNEGSLDASTLKGYASTACTDALNSVSNPSSYTGSGSACDQVQLMIQEYTTTGRTTPNNCWYGGTSSNGPAGQTSSTLTINPAAPLAVSGTLILTVDGDPSVTATLAGPSYKTPAALASALQAAIRAAAGGTADKTKQVQVGGVYTSTTQGTIRITSGKRDGTGSINITGGTARATLGLAIANSTSAGAGTTCVLDQAHTLGGFATGSVGFTANDGLNLGSTTAGSTRFLRFTMSLPSSAQNDVQGRSATMAFTWRLDQ